MMRDRVEPNLSKNDFFAILPTNTEQVAEQKQNIAIYFQLNAVLFCQAI